MGENEVLMDQKGKKRKEKMKKRKEKKDGQKRLNRRAEITILRLDGKTSSAGYEDKTPSRGEHIYMHI